MTVGRRGNGFAVACDRCSNRTQIDRANFHAAIAELKSRGWKIVKERGRHFHHCPNCQGHHMAPDLL